MSRTCDIAIIGNGILGLSLAYALKQRDPTARVVVIGPQARVGAATMAAGAMLNAWGELAADQFAYPALAERARLALAALPLWDPLCAELAEFGAPRPKWGTHLITTSRSAPHEATAVDAVIGAMEANGADYDLVPPTSVSGIAPEQGVAITRAVRIPDGHIDARAVIAAYERALDALEVTRVDATAERISLGKQIALSNGETVAAKHIVFANGSFAQSLIDQLPELKRATPRLVWGGGAGLDIVMPDWVKQYGGLDRSIFEIDAVIRTSDRGGACGVHLVPYGDGAFYLGAASGVWFDPEPQPRLHGLHVLMQALVSEINPAFFFAMMAIRGPGFRPTTIDTFPLLGQSHIDGIWFANGMKRDGFTCSPLLARELASAILGGGCTLPERFHPSRPLISYKQREAAIADTVAANFGGQTQHGLALPPYAVAGHRKGLAAQAAAIYDKRKFTRFGVHPEVLHLFENDQFFAAIDHPRELD